MKAYNSRTHLKECIINLFWIYTPFYSTYQPHEFYSRKALKQAERAFWQLICRTQIDLKSFEIF